MGGKNERKISLDNWEASFRQNSKLTECSASELDVLVLDKQYRHKKLIILKCEL